VLQNVEGLQGLLRSVIQRHQILSMQHMAEFTFN